VELPICGALRNEPSGRRTIGEYAASPREPGVATTGGKPVPGVPMTARTGEKSTVPENRSVPWSSVTFWAAARPVFASLLTTFTSYVLADSELDASMTM